MTGKPTDWQGHGISFTVGQPKTNMSFIGIK